MLHWQQVEDERPAVGVRATSGVPEFVAAWPEALVLSSDALHRRVDDLLLRGAERDAHLAPLVGEHLRAQHARVSDSQQPVHSCFLLCDDEEPRPIGRAVDVRLLDGVVDLLFLVGEHHEVELTGGCHRLDQVLQRISVHPAVQVVSECRHLGVGEEQGLHAALCQIVLHRDVVGEVAVVHQSDADTLSERMRPTGVSHPSTGGEAMVADPDVSRHVLQSIVAEDIFGIAHDLQDEHVDPMTEHERLRAPLASVELDVERVRGVEHDLVEHPLLSVEVRGAQAGLRLELLDGSNPRADEVAHHLRRFDIEFGQPCLPFVQFGHLMDVVHLEGGVDETLLDLAAHRGVEVGDGVEVVFVEDLPRDPELLGVQPDECHASTLAVAAVAHLFQ